MKDEASIVRELLNSEPKEEYLVHYRQKVF